MQQRVHFEDFARVRQLYDDALNENASEQELIYPRAYDPSEYIAQYSDNTASDLRRMAQAMALPPGARVLDGGCGPGAVACLYAEEFGWDILGVDISQRHLERGRQRVSRSPASDRVTLRQQNLYDLSELEQFDGAYGTGAWCHFDAAELFAKLSRIIRPGGRAAFMERTRKGPIPEPSYDAATVGWACPAIYSTDEYIEIMCATSFRVVVVEDMSKHFSALQASQIKERLACREELIERTSQKQFDTSLSLARAEFSLTEQNLLGYALIVAERI
jgi:cyclopropane fatty-acyl-phospholipid synthase-like methyltransferase